MSFDDSSGKATYYTYHYLLSTIFVFPILTWVLTRRFLQQGRRRREPLPPGPPKLPIFGNLFQFPSSYQWLTYAKWSKEYNSDIIHVSGAGQSVVILNTLDAAKEILERRSANYSNRPSFTMNKLMGWDYLFSSMPYGDAWRERRKLLLIHSNPSKPQSHRPIEIDYVRKVLPKLYENPEDSMDLLRHLIGANFLTVAYGLDIKLVQDPFVQLAEDALKPLVEVIVTGAFLVDLIPALQYLPTWFPGTGFKRKAQAWKKLAMKFRDVPFEAAKKSIDNGTAKPSFTSTCLEERIYDEKLIRDTASMFFAGGTDTTLAAVYTFVLVVMCHPEKQEKAQEEMDRVLGHGRLPEHGDEPNLPYLTALIRECIRWKSVTPIGVPHSSEADDVYKGYLIPAGSIIIPNMWNMLHDAVDYPRPDEFIPERFLNEDGQLNKEVRDPLTFAFGFGRRSCPGEHLGKSILWLTAASLLAVFKIVKPVRDGIIVEPSMNYISGLVLHPEAFECDFQPRSKSTETLIKSLID